MRLLKRLFSRLESMLLSVRDDVAYANSITDSIMEQAPSVVEVLKPGDEKHEHMFTRGGWWPELEPRAEAIDESGGLSPPEIAVFHELLICQCGREEVHLERRAH